MQKVPDSKNGHPYIREAQVMVTVNGKYSSAAGKDSAGRSENRACTSTYREKQKLFWTYPASIYHLEVTVTYRGIYVYFVFIISMITCKAFIIVVCRCTYYIYIHIYIRFCQQLDCPCLECHLLLFLIPTSPPLFSLCLLHSTFFLALLAKMNSAFSIQVSSFS